MALAQALAREFDAVGVVNDTVEDGVGERGNTDQVVPTVDGNLTGDDERPVVITIFDDLQHISCLVGCQRLWPPIIQYQQLDAGERSQQSGVARVAVRDGQVGKQPGNAGVENGYVFSARLVAERASEPALAEAAQANDIPPANNSSRSSSNTPITRVRDTGFRWFAAVSMRA